MTDSVTAKRTKQLLIAALAFLPGFFVFVVLHGVFDALSGITSGVAIVSGALGALSVACFYAALFLCPAGFAICLVAGVIVRLTGGMSAWIRPTLLVLVPIPACIAAVLLLLRVLAPSTIERDEAAGFNGSFEVVRSGLPVNWNVYHRPLGDGRAEFAVDSTEAIDGDRSVRFVLQSAFPGRGSRSPGLFQVTDAIEGQTYDVRLWLKNRGSSVRLRITSEFPEGEPKTPVVEIIGPERTGEDEWGQFNFTYTVPPKHHDIRFDLGVTEPGTVWIDDLRFEPVSGS